MKKKNVTVSHCPYCKRHCSLSNPQCKKGKTLAEDIKKADKKRNEDDKLKAGKEKSSTPEEINLLELFQICSAVILHKKGHNRNSKMRKDKRVKEILSFISAKGVLTRKELADYSKLASSDLAQILSKLKKKDYIKWKQEEAGDSQISLTKAGLELMNPHIIERTQDRAEIFSVLSEEEKRDLEKILKKLYSEWSQKPYKAE